MSHDLRRSLADLAQAGSARTTPPADVVARTTADVEHLRRRRPVIIASVTAISVLAAGAAAAAVYTSTRDDASTFPDRPPVTITADPSPSSTPDETPAPPETSAPTEPPAEDPAPVESEAPAAPSALAPLDPAAAFPQCGAAPVSTTGAPVRLQAFDPQSPSPSDGTVTGLEVQALNQSVMQLRAEATDPTLVLVQDGRVVGSAAPSGRTSVVEPLTGSVASFTADLPSTPCLTGPEVPTNLPSGYYEVWAQQSWTVLEQTLEPQEYLRGPVTDVPGTFTTSDLVGGLWLDADGVPSPAPQRPAGWPAEVEWTNAFPTGVTIVWFALGSTPQELLDATRTVDALGYSGQPISVGHCPADPSAALGLSPSTLGVGVVFADRASAESFVALSGAQVLGIVETEPTCPGG